MKKKLLQLVISTSVIILLLFGFQSLAATKLGGDGTIGQLDVFKITSGYIESKATAGYDFLLKGANRYFNFGSTSGNSGYGLRDNSGNIEFKNNGGSWASFSSGAGDVSGPTGAVADNFVSFNSTTGKLIKDSGYKYSDFLSSSTPLQTIINGTGFVKASGTSLSYDNSTYLTSTDGALLYVPYTGATTNLNLGTNNITFGSGTSTVKMTVNELCFSGDGCQTSTVSAGSEITLYHWNQSSDIAGYERLRTTPNNGTEIVETATSSSGTYGLIDSYVSTTTDLSLLNIPAGTWAFHYYADINSNLGDSRMVARVYKRDSGGTETLLLTATSSEMTTGLKEYQFNGFGSATTTLATDRIVIKPYLWSDSVTTKTLSFYYDGLTNYSHVVTPISIAAENFTRSTVNETIIGNWTFPTLKLNGLFYDGTNATGTSGMILSSTGTSTKWINSVGGGITSLNGLTDAVQTFASSTTGTDFGITSSGTTHTFNLPTSSASNRGLLSSTDWSTFNGKQDSNSNLTSLAGLSYSSTSFVKMTGANTFTLDTNTYAAESTSTIGTLINGSTATTSPADTDRFAFSSSSLLRYITWANIKSSLKTYFDTIYQAAGAYLTSSTGITVAQTISQTIGDTTNRLTKLWVTDITATNAINGSITGNAATVTTNANLTGPITSTGNATAVGLTAFANLNAPEGFLINGKIVPSVDGSGNLTIALKTLAGTDPSASDPVYIRLDGIIRSITSALSVSVNAGTNWLNSGSSELATKEIDYFVYLGYQSTVGHTGIRIVIARIPSATLITDFNVSANNEKGSLNNYTAYEVGDSISNIGRFAATLSAGAGYTWSVPTFTASNLIQRPIYETRWLSWVPTPTAVGGGSFTPNYNTTNYKIVGNMVYIYFSTNGHTVSGTVSKITVNLPMADNLQSSAGYPEGIVGVDTVSKQIFYANSNAQTNLDIFTTGGNFTTTAGGGYMGIKTFYYTQ